MHKLQCTVPYRAVTTEFKCNESGAPCEGRSYSCKKSLANHRRLYHATWDSRPCEHGCQPAKIYTTRVQYEAHNRYNHKRTSASRSIKCLHSGCEASTKTYKPTSYKRHPGLAHGLSTPSDRSQYMPAP